MNRLVFLQLGIIDNSLVWILGWRGYTLRFYLVVEDNTYDRALD
jgi:hypothetical protein